MQQDLIKIDDNVQLDHSPVKFEKATKYLTEKVSQTDDFNNVQESKLKWLNHLVKELIERYDKNMQWHFTVYVMSWNELYNQNTRFPSVNVFNALFEYLWGTTLNTKSNMDKLHVFRPGINMYLTKQRANCENNVQLNERKIPKIYDT